MSAPNEYKVVGMRPGADECRSFYDLIGGNPILAIDIPEHLVVVATQYCLHLRQERSRFFCEAQRGNATEDNRRYCGKIVLWPAQEKLNHCGEPYCHQQSQYRKDGA